MFLDRATRSRSFPLYLAIVCMTLSGRTLHGQSGRIASQSQTRKTSATSSSRLVKTDDTSTSTLLWSAPNPSLIGQQLTMTAQVLGDGTSAPGGTVSFENSDTNLGTGDLSSVTNTNYLLYSSQFDNSVWTPYDDNSVVTPNYTTSPLDDQSAYRFQSLSTYGAYIGQAVGGVGGTQPATFSVWLRSNTGSTQTINILIVDADNYSDPGTVTTCFVTTAWQRFAVTTPANITDACGLPDILYQLGELV